MLTPKCSPLIERPARFAASSMTTRPAAASSDVHSEGNHPSDSRPQRSRAAGTVPPSHTSSGCCIGSGESLTSRKLPTAPSWLTVSPAHRRRRSGSASSMTAPRRLGSTPMASRSGAYVSPGTSVTSNRPLHSTSRLASCLASRSTLRPGNSIVLPTFNRGLLAAAQARPTTGSSTGPVSTSESQRESNPRSSSPVQSSASASGVEDAAAAPIPMRIFMSTLARCWSEHSWLHPDPAVHREVDAQDHTVRMSAGRVHHRSACVVGRDSALAHVGLHVLVTERDVVPAGVTDLVGEDRRRPVGPLPRLVKEAVTHGEAPAPAVAPGDVGERLELQLV